MHGRMWGERKGKERNWPDLKCLSGAPKGSAVMESLMAFGCILYLGSRGACLKAKTDMKKKHLQEKSLFIVRSFFPT